MNQALGVAIFTIGATAVIGLIGWLLARVLTNIDQNQTNIATGLGKLWADYDVTKKDFYELRGEHHVNHKGKP